MKDKKDYRFADDHFSEGYDEGHSAGLTQGYKEGMNKGYEEGYEQRKKDLRELLEATLSSEKKALTERTSKDNVYNEKPRFAFHMQKIRRSEIKIELLKELLAELDNSSLLVMENQRGAGGVRSAHTHKETRPKPTQEKRK